VGRIAPLGKFSLARQFTSGNRPQMLDVLAKQDSKFGQDQPWVTQNPKTDTEEIRGKLGQKSGRGDEDDANLLSMVLRAALRKSPWRRIESRRFLL
jgi:hypothetical protein